MARNLTDEDVDALSKALGKQINSRAPTSSGSANLNIPGTNQQLSIFDKALDSAGKGSEKLKEAYGRVEKSILEGMDTWRNLSKAGVSFNNDIVGMTVAAQGTRMGLGEFAEMVNQNRVFLAGFGGSVSKGAEEFAKTSKVMFDEYGQTTDRLRQMGYTNKDLNEVLALQSGMIGSSMRQGKERDAIAIKSATELATEMDLMAKMTGKSRQEQMENAKKLQADAAFNAKMQQMTANMGEKEAAEYKTKMMAEYAKAEAIGMGQAFKETYTFGQVMTKEAATQQAIAGKAGYEAQRAAMAASAGNFEEAARRNSAATDAAIANNKNKAFQDMVIFGSFTGAVGEAAQKQYMVNKAQTDSLEALKREPGMRGKTDEELRKIATDRAREEQNTAKGSTAAAVNIEQRFKDASSALASSLIKPLNEDVNPALRKLADSALGARGALVPGQPPGGTRTFAQGIEQEVAEGRRKAEQGKPPTTAGTTAQIALQTAGAAGYGLGQAVNTAGEYADKKLKEPSKRPTGTIGETGSFFELPGSILEITRADETVLTSDQMKNLAKGMLDKGAEKALYGLKSVSNQSSLPMPAMNFDFAKISTEISKSFDSIPKSMPSMATKNLEQMQNPFASLNVSDISKNLSTTFSGVFTTASKSSQAPAELSDLGRPFSDAFSSLTSKFKNLFKGSSEKIAEPFDEFAGLDEAIAKQLPFDEFAGLDEAIKKQLPFDEFAGLDEFIAKQLPFDEFAGLDEAIKKQLPFDEFVGLDAFIAKQLPFDEFAGLDEAIAKQLPFDEFAGLDEAIAKQLSFDEFGANFDEVVSKMAEDISDAIPVDYTKELAQVRIDQAKQSHDLAKEEVTKLLNDANASDEDINAAYEKYKDAYDNLNKVVDESIGDLAGGFDNFSDGFEDSVEKIRADISDAIPFDEFAGVDEAIAKQKAYSDMGEFAGLDAAIAKQKAYSDMGEFAGVDEAIAKQKAYSDMGEFAGVDKAIARQQQPFDEFAGLDAAIAKQKAYSDMGEFAGVDEAVARNKTMDEAVQASSPTSSGGFNLDSLSFGPKGMPVVKQIKSAAASIPEKKQPSPGKAINQDTGEEYTPIEELEKQKAEADKKSGAAASTSKPATAAGGKEANLNDVVTALNSLNTKMGQLITKTEDLFNKQINATKSNSSNIYART